MLTSLNLPRLRVLRSVRGILTVTCLVIVVSAFVARQYWPSSESGPVTPDAAPLVAEVIVGPYTHEVVERGDIGSSSNVEVRSEVRSRTALGTTILEIVPEGTRVKPGDFLVRLDDSSLQMELISQQIVVKNSEATVIQTETAVETAQLTLQEYESGTYKQSVEELQAARLVAEENLRRAQEYLLYSERLSKKGYVTEIQLDADRFAVLKAKKDLDVAETKLDVVTNFTKEKTVKRYEADIQAAEARLRAARDSHKIEVAALAKIEQQIEKCVIRAPVAGQVVYANEAGRSTEPLIEEGRVVRERQTIVRLPDPDRMQVTAKVHESRVDLVEAGQAVEVRVDALPGVVLQGRVRKVAEYPLPTNVYTGSVKNYQTDIDIIDPPEDLRPGMTAEVSVLVEQLAQATQIPAQSVVEREGHYYCLVEDDDHHLSSREVEIGSCNDKHLVVESGLEPGERVVLTPKPFLDLVQLPAADEASEVKIVRQRRGRTTRQELAAVADEVATKADNESRRETQLAEQPGRHVVKKPPLEVAAGAH